MMGFAKPVTGPATSGRTRWLYPSYTLACLLEKSAKFRYSYSLTWGFPMRVPFILAAVLVFLISVPAGAQKSPSPPPGSYMQSCKNITAEFFAGYSDMIFVKANCRNSRGAFVHTDLVVETVTGPLTKDIANCNGALTLSHC